MRTAVALWGGAVAKMQMHVGVDGTIDYASTPATSHDLTASLSPRMKTLSTLQKRASELMQAQLSPDAKKVIVEVLLPTVQSEIVTSIAKEFATAQGELKTLVDALEAASTKAATLKTAAVSRDNTLIGNQQSWHELLSAYERCEAEKNDSCEDKKQQCATQRAAAAAKCTEADTAATIDFTKICLPETCNLKTDPTCGSQTVQQETDGWLADARAKMEAFQQLETECWSMSDDATRTCTDAETHCAADHCAGERTAYEQKKDAAIQSEGPALLAKCEFGHAAQAKCADLTAVHDLIAKIKATNRQDALSEADRVAEFAAVQRLICLLQALHDEGDLSTEATTVCAGKTPYPHAFDYFDQKIADLTAGNRIACTETAFTFSGYAWTTGATSADFAKAQASHAFTVDSAAQPFVSCGAGSGTAQAPCEAASAGQGGWQLVRHVGPGNSWHPATDQLTGSSVYGTPSGPTSSEAWSVKFNVDDVEEFLFSTGDCQKWLVAEKDAVIGWYSNDPRQIQSSSLSATPYTAKWYRRQGASEDPWISITDHHPAIGDGDIVYGANGYGGTHAAAVLPIHNGANVYIRQ
mmetsp:Transcript_122259/g.280045  ORF Transcript_122259/g.280045 Transcript_122259/m.280045 type:complete len:582 (-) Transcript_122259:229-1974(-)